MRRLLVAAGLLGACLWWCGDSASPAQTELQAAVLRDGFAVRAGERVVELDRQGRERAEHALRHHDMRIVGTRAGAAAAWLADGQIRVASLRTNKLLGVWGKHARRLCEGVATNQHRFAVGWLESDGKLWFVHGPTGVAALEPAEPVQAAQADPKEWCGVASADAKIALFWRDRGRLMFNTCTEKKCSGLPASVGFDPDDTLLGFGCLRNACLLAARARNGTAVLGYVTESGSVKWRKPLDGSVRSVSIVGAGDRAFAVGYADDAGAHVMRVERKGAMTRVWQGPAAAGVPVLAWSNGQLLVAQGGQRRLIAMPR